MDAAFQKIQSVMAEQNGAESTRYCGGCHDPISLFSGTKNIGVEDLTGLHGYQEGVSCLACHAIRETDLQGNANYVVARPASTCGSGPTRGPGKRLRDFLIRTYPDEHNKLSKRAYKAPEYCAACHKQFIDQEVNRVGWVQLQNQYDNWKASHWNVEGDPQKTVECRECHMPLVVSDDPAAGDAADYNRTPDDGKHRSHRFIASNGMMPAVLQVEGWEEQVELTEKWLQGKFEIPEIETSGPRDRSSSSSWRRPETVRTGRGVQDARRADLEQGRPRLPDRPAGHHPELGRDARHRRGGQHDLRHGAARREALHRAGSFLFKVEPVDQYGNLIDRHNLWEMVGVRFRRALFPGYSDTVDFSVSCPSELAPQGAPAGARTSAASRTTTWRPAADGEATRSRRS